MSSPLVPSNEQPGPEPGPAALLNPWGHPVNHLEFALLLPPAQDDRCVVCGKPSRDVGCERCGAGLHDTCYFWFVVPRAEREFYNAHDPAASLRMQPDAEDYFYMCDDGKYLMEEHGAYAFICRWCRG